MSLNPQLRHFLVLWPWKLAYYFSLSLLFPHLEKPRQYRVVLRLNEVTHIRFSAVPVIQEVENICHLRLLSFYTVALLFTLPSNQNESLLCPLSHKFASTNLWGSVKKWQRRAWALESNSLWGKFTSHVTSEKLLNLHHPL